MVWETKVKKRLGKVEDFDKEKIATSIFKAAQRVGGKDTTLAENLSEKVENFLKEKFPKARTISTDEIGDAVEKVLIEEGHAKTAKTFILYREGQKKSRKKLIKIRDIPQLREFLKLTDRKSVFVTGIYDLFHIGHARYLKKASLQGDVLIVGLNSDESVRGLKGDSRPILGEEIRAEMLSYFEFIDFIVIYQELDGAKVIKELKPDVYVCIENSWQGSLENKAEVKEAKRYGGKVVVLPYQSSEVSTTLIIDKVKNGESNSRDTQLVVAAFLIEDGKVLLVKQKNHDFWTPPGGLVEIGDEAPENACKREVKEEIGVEIACYGVFPPIIYKDEKSQKRFLILNYLARRNRAQDINIHTKESKEDEGKVENYQWIKFEDLKEIPLAKNVLPVIREITKNSLFWEQTGLKGELKTQKEKEDLHFIEIAELEAKKSTCSFRKVGCLVAKNGNVILSTYNEVMPDEEFCKRAGCVREKLGVLPGEKLELCTVIHAESNLLAKAAKKGISLEGTTMYLTTFPCSICAKSIAQAGIKKMVFLGDYSNLEGLSYLKSRNVEVVKFEKDEQGISTKSK